jgi:hypothetical protein
VEFLPFSLIHLHSASNFIEAAQLRDETQKVDIALRIGWQRPAPFSISPCASDRGLPVWSNLHLPEHQQQEIRPGQRPLRPES